MMMISLTKLESFQLICICQLLLIVVVRVSDFLMEYFSSCNICRVLSDNMCHSTIAGIIFLITNISEKLLFLSYGSSFFCRNRVIIFNVKDVIQIVTSLMIGSLLDLDHIIYAQSFSYYIMTHLPSRPFGHSIVFCIVLSIISFLVMRCPRAGVLTFSAIFSHQLRDSVRRGLWLWPWGSTPKLPIEYVSVGFAVLPIVNLIAILLLEKKIFIFQIQSSKAESFALTEVV
mmetsp:Transcript_30990/g.44527  ORF Transcript_30990/g.44527 Transcript_30990/m.44527 type:complete len:230 (+) Transcript_30990:61-750(+)